MRAACRQSIAVVLGVLAVVALLGSAGPRASWAQESLRRFAERVGLQDVESFADTVERLRQSRRLPDRYLTEQQAAMLGWHPGYDLCRYAQGRAIGGDRFWNFERRLPEGPGREYFEADLDTSCGPRGARRLAFSNDGLEFVTLDHYETFMPVPH